MCHQFCLFKVAATTFLNILPLGDLIENQSISIPFFLLRHCHVAYISARPHKDLLHTNLSVLIGLIITSVRFFFV